MRTLPPLLDPPRSGVRPGWYRVQGTLRWFDGELWRAFVAEGGQVSAERHCTVRPPTAILLTVATLLLAAPMVVVTAVTLSTPPVDEGVVVPALLVGVLLAVAVWQALVARDGLSRGRLPVPTAAASAPLPAGLGPLPSEVETGAPAEAGAMVAPGWYLVGLYTDRWWTGRRWAPYACYRRRVLPTHLGPRWQRRRKLIALPLLVLGALALLVGQLGTGVLGTAPAAMASMTGALVVAIGVSLLAWGAIVRARDVPPRQPPSPVTHRPPPPGMAAAAPEHPTGG